ncbi:MAG TPA: glycosyltransferase [Pyrinomonadaceae bacterium]|nr:glycosyltransferase [Pyrinomonadaceae bacterium]
MKRVGIVVQRCHESVVGGAEALAWQYANLLKDDYEVDVLTTTAVDAAYWANALPEGAEVREGVTIRRFHVDIGYSPYRSALFAFMLQDFKKYRPQRKATNGTGGVNESSLTRTHLPWSIPLQEELIRNIGPYSSSLLAHIENHITRYQTIIFVTYLYPTTYFGLLQVPLRYAMFAPTLHDEEPAYLSAYQHAARRAGSLIWLSEGEQRLGFDLWGDLPGSIVGLHIDAKPRALQPSQVPYLLYSGRIDPNKGCGELFDYFLRFKEEFPSNLRLVLTGKNDMPIPNHPDIDFRGFVSEEEKFALMAGASVYMTPSGKESFSIVTLEAMAQKTPVLASGACEVIVDHISRSEGGKIYNDYQSFAAALDQFLHDEKLNAASGERGRAYVLANFTSEIIKKNLLQTVESHIEALASTLATTTLPETAAPQAANEPVRNYVVPKSIDLSYSPALELPAGWTEEALRELVTSIQVEDGPEEELRNYASDDFKRFIYTLGLVPEERDLKILELGANPYFTTTLLRKFRQADLHLANFFSESQAPESEQKVTIHSTGEEICYRFKHFNVESDTFPYADETFDVVLFCEILEHLLEDPVHALAEIRRVLKPGGTLIVTTPNVVRLENVRKMIAGENIYDPYSGYGPYGRHNREYTQQDIFSLLTANGFRPDSLFTADVTETQELNAESLESVAGLMNRRPELGQYIFCRSTLSADAKEASAVRPDWLYRSMPQ